MPKPPAVSVIIVNYNGGEYTPACLDSIPGGTEIIVVDNGSKDGSADAIAAKYPAVQVLRNTANLGFARAVNQGIAASTGRYVCLLNNDARLSPDTLATLLAYMDAHPDVGMTAPQLLHEDGRKQHSFDNFPSLATALLNKSLLRRLAPDAYPSKTQDYKEPREVASVIGACMMVRRDVVDRIGPLDEAYFLFLEETDWCLRCRRAGYKVVFVPGSTVVHLQGKTRDQVRVRGRIEYTRSLFTYFRKNRPGSSLLLRLLFPVKNLIEVLFQTLGLFLPKVRRRWVETAALLGWQLCGAPRSWGLSMGIDPKFITLRDGTRVLEEHAEAFNDFDGKRRTTKVLKDLHLKRTLEYAAGPRSYYIKIYKAPVWSRKLKNFLVGSRARRELEMSLGVFQRGIPHAPVAAMRESWDETWVAIEKLGDWAQLQATILAASDRRKLCALYGRFARRLHEAGVWQYDFNPTNVLYKDGRCLLIDFELMKLYPRAVPESLRLKSLGKMNRVPTVSKSDRLRFLLGYLEADAVERKRWKNVARQVLALYTAQMARDNERSERRCMDENRDFGAFAAGEWRGHYLKKRADRPGGLAIEEVRVLAEGGSEGYRLEPASDAIAEWQKANRKAKEEGAPLPVAVVLKGHAREGKIAFLRK